MWVLHQLSQSILIDISYLYELYLLNLVEIGKQSKMLAWTD